MINELVIVIGIVIVVVVRWILFGLGAFGME